MIIGMHGANDTRKRFGQRCRIKSFTVIRQQTISLHHLIGNNHIRSVTANIGITVSRCTQYSHGAIFIIQRRLNGKFITNFKSICPLRTNFNQLTGKFMTNDYRILGNVIGHPLVVCSLNGRFIGRHTQRITNNFSQNLIIFYRRQFKFFQPKIILTIQTNRFCFHKF